MSLKIAKMARDSGMDVKKDIKAIRALARDECRVRCEDDSRTKQSFKEDCDINLILEKASRTGMVSHLSKYGAQYGDFVDVDFESMLNTVAEANTLFAELPAEVRREFGNSQQKFFDFVNDPANKDDLHEKLPALAKAGTQLPQVDRSKTTIEMSPKGGIVEVLNRESLIREPEPTASDHDEASSSVHKDSPQQNPSQEPSGDD